MPDHPLFRRFENELTLGQHKLEWMTHGRDFFCRPVGNDVDVVWCQPAHCQVPGAFLHVKRHNNALRLIEREFQNRNLWRFVSLEDGFDLLLCLDFVLMRHESFSFLLRLDWSRPLFSDLSELMFDKIKVFDLDDGWISGGFGDWRLAVQLFNGEWWGRFDCIGGSIEQLKELVRSYLLLSGNYLRYYGRKDLKMQSLLENYHVPEKRLEAQQVGRLLDQQFRLQWKDSARRLYVASGKSIHHPSFWMNAPTGASQHERLEALLLWRDFLRDKIPPDEIESLLKPFAT